MKTEIDFSHLYTAGEEIANSITHGIGAVLSVAGLTLLVALAALRGDAWDIVSYAIYGGSLVTLYLISTLYHSFRRPRIKQFFRKLDHSAIFVLIAGTYTPYLLNLRDVWGWTLLAVIWGLALAGIVYKFYLLDRFPVAGTLVYLFMGWLAVPAWRHLATAVPEGGMAWLIAGGVVYTLGVIFYAWQKLPYNHAIWHLFVMGGSACHFVSIFHLVPVV